MAEDAHRVPFHLVQGQLHIRKGRAGDALVDERLEPLRAGADRHERIAPLQARAGQHRTPDDRAGRRGVHHADRVPLKSAIVVIGLELSTPSTYENRG